MNTVKNVRHGCIKFIALLFSDWMCLNRKGAVSTPYLWCDNRWNLLHGLVKFWFVLRSQESLSGGRNLCTSHGELLSSDIENNSNRMAFSAWVCMFLHLKKTTGTWGSFSSNPQPESSRHPDVLSEWAGGEQWSHRLWNKKLLDRYVK